MRDLLARAQAGCDNRGIWDRLDTDVQRLLKTVRAHEVGKNRIMEGGV
jgi:hypothetical protein